MIEFWNSITGKELAKQAWDRWVETFRKREPVSLELGHHVAFLGSNTEFPTRGDTIERWHLCSMGMSVRRRQHGLIRGVERKKTYGSTCDHPMGDPYVIVQFEDESSTDSIHLNDIHRVGSKVPWWNVWKPQHWVNSY